MIKRVQKEDDSINLAMEIWSSGKNDRFYKLTGIKIFRRE